MENQPSSNTEPWGYQQPAPAEHHKTIPWKIILVVLIGLAVVITTGWLVFGRKSVNTTVIASPTPIAGKQIERPCFSFTVPDDFQIPDERTCELEGSAGSFGITIAGFSEESKSPEAELTEWKGALPKTQRVANERTIDVGGRKGTIFDVESAEAKDTLDEYSIVVIGTDNKYTVHGKPTPGFSIMASHSNDAAAKQILTQILASWQWK